MTVSLNTTSHHYTPQPEDLPSLLSIKLAVRYAQLREVESMRAVARAHQNRNLAEFERALRDYREGRCQAGPVIIFGHTDALPRALL
jgi:hypothetical protein